MSDCPRFSGVGDSGDYGCYLLAYLERDRVAIWSIG